MITRLPQAVLLRPRRCLGDLYPDVIIEESHEDGLEVTEHPVELGADISDHAYVQASTLTLRGGVSDSTANGQFFGNPRPSQHFYYKLLELQRSREPFTIITGKRIYANMLITRLSVSTTVDSEYSLLFTAECREVLIAQTRLVSVPPRQRHQNAAKTGAEADTGVKQAEPTEQRSILSAALG